MAEINQQNGTATNPATPKRKRRLGRKLFWVLLIAFGVMAAWRPLEALRHSHGSHGIGSLSHRSPHSWAGNMEEATNWLLSRVNATEAQRQEIQRIQSGTLGNLQALEAEHRSLQERAHGALESNPVDREELERIRLASLELADRASRQAVDGFVQALDVLTPEQRAEILEMWNHRR